MACGAERTWTSGRGPPAAGLKIRHYLGNRSIRERDERFAVDLVYPFRLAFEVARGPIPRYDFRRIDKRRVTGTRIVEAIE